MRFKLLGDIGLSIGGREVDLGHLRRRSVLAGLLIDANTTVSVEVLTERVWGRRAPRSTGTTLRSYLSRLRTALAPAPRCDIVRRPEGYRIEVDETAIDLHRFRTLAAQARTERDERAVQLLRQALGLWTGEPFTGIENDVVNGIRAHLEDEHRAARLDYHDALLRTGAHSMALPSVRTMLADDPYNERLVGQLMLALHGTSGQREALLLYDGFRRRLAEDVGADPGPPLRELHSQILRNAPEISAPASTALARASASTSAGKGRETVQGGANTPAGSAGGYVPRQLPAVPSGFVGRQAELAALDGESTGRRRDGGITVITGPGGVGKTWTALHWAHLRLDDFPDGQLYVNLRGFDPAAPPASPAAVLPSLLTALQAGQAASRSADIDAQIALFRSVVADRRVLIVLDNARDADQVLPLLPGGRHCRVLITSRNRLTGVTSSLGAERVDLDVFDRNTARETIARSIGQESVSEHRPAVEQLIDSSAGLPLALGIACARIGAGSTVTVTSLVRELREGFSELDMFEADGGDDASASLRAVLSSSYQVLRAAEARVFEQLALPHGDDLALDAARSLTGLPPRELRQVLRVLESLHLIRQHVPGRFRMHDLVRHFAREMAQANQTAQERREAVLRLADHYAHTASSAERLLHPHGVTLPLGTPPVGCVPRPPADEAEALRWFRAEHENLLAAHATTAEYGLGDHAWQLALSLDTYLLRCGLHTHHVKVLQQAVEEMTTPQLAPIRRYTRARLGAIANYVDIELAERVLDTTLEEAERVGDLHTAARAHRYRAQMHARRGETRSALADAQRALELFIAVDDPAWAGYQHNSVGWYHAENGDYELARQHCRLALELTKQHRFDDGEAATLHSLAVISAGTGRYAEALDYYQRSLDLCRRIGHDARVPSLLDSIGDIHAELGAVDRAEATWQRAVDLYASLHLTDESEAVVRKLRAARAGPRRRPGRI
ncbi:AfsR/SARP family transcriptional regulator [Streptomyces winkii]|uniref:AfsR/SARP family transcriptional regulator n=1 Tax=Streptomyces winkii TaxID=3051178 RepID=UPI0028D60B4C|nr:BTAD domain-containing putative transcriptional regulator [Streptomyces sp. DSM 40971]